MEMYFEIPVFIYGMLNCLVVDKPKIKLYRDANGQIKGDGRCCYLKVIYIHSAGFCD